jgi:hypothetical protein
MEGPPVFKLYDPSSSSSEALSSIFKAPRTVLEYLVISPKPTSASEASVQKILQKLQSGLAQLGTTNAVVGESTNLASREIAVFGSYASQTVSFSQ